MKITSIKPAQPPLPASLLRLDYTSDVDAHADWAMVHLGPKTDNWLIVLHGHGSHGDQLYTRPDIRDSWLPLFYQTGYSILTPNLRDNAWMSPAAAADLLDLTQHLSTAHHARRIILISGSMGGTSNLIFAALHPEMIHGVIAICPATDLATYHAWCRSTAKPPVVLEIADAIQTAYAGNPIEKPDLYRRHSALLNASRLTMPVYINHGDADEIIPVSESQALAQAIGTSRNFRYDQIPAGGHDTPLWKLPEALEWLIGRL